LLSLGIAPVKLHSYLYDMIRQVDPAELGG